MSEHDADETVVTLKGIRKSFSGNEILKGIDLEIYKGEVLAILGSSGSGKTTLLRCVNALEQPDAGIVRVFQSEWISTLRGIGNFLGA